MEFDSKKAVIVPEGVFIIGTYDENGVPNAMNAAWGIQSDYGEITRYRMIFGCGSDVAIGRGARLARCRRYRRKYCGTHRR